MTKTIDWLRRVIPVLIVLMAAWVAVPSTGEAQQEREECRCVDSSGEEIEDCTCFRSPRIENVITSVIGSRPRLGISIEPTQNARYDAVGARITDVMDGGPADEAGLQDGDVITSIDGQPLTEPIGSVHERSFNLDQSVPVQRLLALARELEPGQEVEIEYERDGEPGSTVLEAEDLSQSWGRNFSMAIPRWNEARFRDQLRDLTDRARDFEVRAPRGDDVRIRLGSPSADWRVFGPGASVLYGARSRDGLDLVELNPALGEYFGAEEGVLVLDAEPDSGLGLEPGDVVLSVGDRPVATPDRFRRILSSYGEDENINFVIRRDGAETTVTGRLRYH